MDLIGERDEETERQHETVDGIPCMKFVRCLEVHEVGEDDQSRERDETVVPICFDEVVAGDGKRINVMLTERTNKCLQVRVS